MAKTTAPLLSFGASGQIGQTLVASKWKGRPYMRRYTVPANPNTTEQQNTRTAFSALQSMYKTMPAEVTAAWDAYAQGQVLTGRNAFTKKNLPILRPAGGAPVTTFDNFLLSPGAYGGLVPATFIVTPGNDQLTLAATFPAVLPSGWTALGMTFAVLLEQDPTAPTDLQVTAVDDDAAAYSQVIAGLASVAEYQCFCIARYTRADGSIAYAQSVQDQGITT